MRRLNALATVLQTFERRDRTPDIVGTVSEICSNAIGVRGLSPWASLGDLVEIGTAAGPALAEVLRVEADRILVMPHQLGDCIGLGAEARLTGEISIAPDDSWRGRTIDPFGNPLDGARPLAAGPMRMRLERSPPPALARRRVDRPVRTGIKAIDIFTPLCAGQRIGVFAGSGVGKSTLLSMLAGLPDVDVAVIALVGERSREVRDFIEDTLGTARERAILVVATGDDSPMLRRLAPHTATAIAEHFRDQGRHVLLVIDSLTRFAHAHREFALASGEPPVARGYPPSTFQAMAGLLERSGPGAHGAGDITLVASVLVDGDDHNDPVADAARGILDGHIVLDRRIAAQGRWPAIDLLGSVSRLAMKAWSAEERALAQTARALIAKFEETRDLRLLGGYQAGQDPLLDRAVALAPQIYAQLTELPTTNSSNGSFEFLRSLLTPADAVRARAESGAVSLASPQATARG